MSAYAKPAFGPRRQRSPALIARCAIRYREGWSLADIAIAENCAPPTIRSILVEAGIEIRGRGAAADSFRFCAQRCWPHNLEGDAA